MQSHYRMFPAGNVSCNLTTECFLQEMSHEISLQNVSCRKCLMQSHYRVFPAGNISCNSLQNDSFNA